MLMTMITPILPIRKLQGSLSASGPGLSSFVSRQEFDPIYPSSGHVQAFRFILSMLGDYRTANQISVLGLLYLNEVFLK